MHAAVIYLLKPSRQKFLYAFMISPIYVTYRDEHVFRGMIALTTMSAEDPYMGGMSFMQQASLFSAFQLSKPQRK
jgi:hypothetical protein